MVIGINTEAQQNTAGFIYFGKQDALPVYRSVISLPCTAAKDNGQNRLTMESYVASKAL